MRTSKKMVRFSIKPGTANISILLLFLTIIVSCASAPRDNNRLNRGIMAQYPLIESEFNHLWEQWTITIPDSRNYMGGSGLMFGSQGSRGDGPFSLRIQATIMDPALIEAGIDQFAELADMSEGEKEAFARRYREEHYRNDYIFVWAEITTPYAESYLNLDRWTFYLMDESGMKYEPKEIVPRETHLEYSDSTLVRPEGLNPQIPIWLSEPNPWKEVGFYFPKNKPDGDPILTANTEELSFGVVMINDMDERGEGTWNLDTIRNRLDESP